MNNDVADVVRLSAEANLALVQGDIDGYLSRFVNAADYTLMSPFGGKTEHGFADSPERRAAMKQFFRSGTLDQELVATYASVDSGWQLAHRHADPLGPGISVERMAALARGEVA